VQAPLQIGAVQLHEVGKLVHPRGHLGVAGNLHHERPSDDLPHRHPRVERGLRVLEHHLEASPRPAQLPGAERGEIHAVEPHGPRGRLDQAQRAAQGRALALPTNRLPDQPEGLPGNRPKDTPATARTPFDRRPPAPNVLTRSRTSSSSRRSAVGPTPDGTAIVMPTPSGPRARRGGRRRRTPRSGAVAVLRAHRCRRRRDIGGGTSTPEVPPPARRRAADRAQVGRSPVQPRQRGEQATGVRVARSVEGLVDGHLLHDVPRLHDGHQVGEPGHHA
jgi:hypothetical protein